MSTSPASALDIDLSTIRAAAERISPVAHRTPVLTSRRLNDLTGAEVYIKAEHLQRTGSFKIRGAYNAISSLPEDLRAKGVAAFSSGNHAQAVAHSAQLHEIPAVIVMPHDAPSSKRAASFFSFTSRIQYMNLMGAYYVTQILYLASPTEIERISV